MTGAGRLADPRDPRHPRGSPNVSVHAVLFPRHNVRRPWFPTANQLGPRNPGCPGRKQAVS
eukprot:9469081-Pyramimonas_sp.AAC.1